jgi:hypothetical protein
MLKCAPIKPDIAAGPNAEGKKSSTSHLIGVFTEQHIDTADKEGRIGSKGMSVIRNFKRVNDVLQEQNENCRCTEQRQELFHMRLEQERKYGPQKSSAKVLLAAAKQEKDAVGIRKAEGDLARLRKMEKAHYGRLKWEKKQEIKLAICRFVELADKAVASQEAMAKNYPPNNDGDKATSALQYLKKAEQALREIRRRDERPELENGEQRLHNRDLRLLNGALEQVLARGQELAPDELLKYSERLIMRKVGRRRTGCLDDWVESKWGE